MVFLRSSVMPSIGNFMRNLTPLYRAYRLYLPTTVRFSVVLMY